LIFEYQNDKTKEIIECDFSFGKMPPLVVEKGGKKYHRIYRNLNIVYGATFHNDGQIKFKRPPLEGEGFEYT
jgi:hypothetical protein